MLIPERTVDSFLAYELLHAFPEAILWSPTNTAGSLDHELELGGAQAILFERVEQRSDRRVLANMTEDDRHVRPGSLGLLC